MSYLKSGAKFSFDHEYIDVTYTVDVTVIEECRPCARAAEGRPYITGPGPHLRLKPMLNGRRLPAGHSLNVPFRGGSRLLAAAQAAYHHPNE